MQLDAQRDRANAEIEGIIALQAGGALGLGAQLVATGCGGRYVRDISNGYARLGDLPPGSYRVELVGARFVFARRVELVPGRRLRLAFRVP